MKVINGKLDGWCEVGSTVVTDFYINYRDMKRRVEKIHIYEDVRSPQAKVWLTNMGREPLEVDFETWVRKPEEKI